MFGRGWAPAQLTVLNVEQNQPSSSNRNARLRYYSVAKSSRRERAQSQRVASRLSCLSIIFLFGFTQLFPFDRLHHPSSKYSRRLVTPPLPIRVSPKKSSLFYLNLAYILIVCIRNKNVTECLICSTRVILFQVVILSFLYNYSYIFCCLIPNIEKKTKMSSCFFFNNMCKCSDLGS